MNTFRHDQVADLRGAAKPHRLARRWLGRATMIAVATIVAAGCTSGNKTELPSLEKDQRKMLSKEEQKKAITTMGQKADADAAAARQDAEKKSK